MRLGFDSSRKEEKQGDYKLSREAPAELKMHQLQQFCNNIVLFNCWKKID